MGFAMPVIVAMVGVTVVTAAAVGALMLFTTFVKPAATAVTHVSAAAEDSSAAFKLTTLTVRRRRRFLTPLSSRRLPSFPQPSRSGDRKSTRLNSSHLGISYAVFCLKK